MTRRGVISIHDYPEHLNPFREDDEETPRKHNRRERAGLNTSTRLGSPSQSPAKPERPPLPHRTRHKNKENEVASPDEDKYFRQGAKPKKKRPAPMPPSPNQQKMTPAVSDGSLDSSASSTSPNVTEVTESSATKGQAQSPQKNPAQELNKEKDTTSVNGKIPLDLAQHSSEEIKRPSEEVRKPSDDGMKPLSEETNLKTDETKLEIDETKIQAEETTSQSEETKSQSEETKSQSEETKSQPEETKSQPEETKSQPEETKSQSEETKSQSEETKSQSEETKSQSEETKSQSEETKSQSEETKSQSEETKSQSEETKSQPEETKLQSEETKSHSEDKASQESRETKAQMTEGVKTQDEVGLPNDDRKLQNCEENDPSCNIKRTPDTCATPIKDTTTEEGVRTREEIDLEMPEDNIKLQEHTIKTLPNEAKFQESENMEVPKENGLLEPKTTERTQDVHVIDNQTAK